MKQNNKFNKFGKSNQIEKFSSCSCGSQAKLKTRRNYPHGKKSKAIVSQLYECEKCGNLKIVADKKKGGRK